jgi:hypothetical protein
MIILYLIYLLFVVLCVYTMFIGIFEKIESWFKKKPPTPPKDHSKDYF